MTCVCVGGGIVYRVIDCFCVGLVWLPPFVPQEPHKALSS